MKMETRQEEVKRQLELDKFLIEKTNTWKGTVPLVMNQIISINNMMTHHDRYCFYSYDEFIDLIIDELKKESKLYKKTGEKTMYGIYEYGQYAPMKFRDDPNNGNW